MVFGGAEDYRRIIHGHPDLLRAWWNRPVVVGSGKGVCPPRNRRRSVGDGWARCGRHIAIGIQRENGIRDRRFLGTLVVGNRGRDSQDHYRRRGWGCVWIQVEEGTAVNGVVVDHDDGVVERRSPFRPDETISLDRLLEGKPQRIECSTYCTVV